MLQSFLRGNNKNLCRLGVRTHPVLTLGMETDLQKRLWDSNRQEISVKEQDTSVSNCLGSSQDRINFCSSQEGPWPGHGSYSIPPHVIAGGARRLFQGEVVPFQSRKLGNRSHPLLSIIRVGFFHVSNFFPCTLCHQYCCYCSFSHLIAVSSKLSLSQPVIFAFCASNSPLQSTIAGRGRGKVGEQESSFEVLGTLNWGATFLNHHSLILVPVWHEGLT